MPFILENIDRYIIYFKNNALYIEDKLLHQQDWKKVETDNDEKKRRV